MQIIQIVAPIFLIILLGYILRRNEIVKAEWVKTLNAYAYYVALPAIIIYSFWEINWQNKQVLSMLGLNAGLMFLAGAALFVILKNIKASGALKAAIFMLVLVGNTVYMGFPIASKAFSGENLHAAIASATLQLVLGLMFSVFAIEYFAVRSRKIARYFLDFIKNPLFISMCIGAVLGIFKPEGLLVDIFKAPLNMLAATASPVALFALGAFFHGRYSAPHLKLTLFVSGLKLLLTPAVFWLLLLAFKVNPNAAGMTGLIFAMPAAASCFVLAEKFNLEKEFTANGILISTIFSVLSIPLFLLLI